MSIYVARITKIAQPLPSIPSSAPTNTLNLNCLNFFENNIAYNLPLFQVTPYYLKDSENHIMENLWQGSKVYPSVEAQNEIKAGKIIWSHPAEVHVKDGQLTSQFWAWRKKLWNNPYPVRYPNGYYGRHKCLYALWYEVDSWPNANVQEPNTGSWIRLDYIAARKKIYCSVYASLVQQTEAYQMLKKLHDEGTSLQICEMDVRPGLVTEEVLRRELNNPHQSFGHGYVLAACLMGLTHIFTE